MPIPTEQNVEVNVSIWLGEKITNDVLDNGYWLPHSVLNHFRRQWHRRDSTIPTSRATCRTYAIMSMSMSLESQQTTTTPPLQIPATAGAAATIQWRLFLKD